MIRRSRLQVEALYEKKLNQQSPSGAMFALKNMGWNEKTDDRPINEKQIVSLKIEIVDSGPKIAQNEAEVLI